VVLGEPVFWTIVVFAIVASEREVNFDPAALTLQTMGSPASQSRWYFSLLMLVLHIELY
jgi:hypothetical protein